MPDPAAPARAAADDVPAERPPAEQTAPDDGLTDDGSAGDGLTTGGLTGDPTAGEGTAGPPAPRGRGRAGGRLTAAAGAWAASGARRWTATARLLRRLGPGPTAAVVVLHLAVGLLPIGFILATSHLIADLPHAVAASGHGGQRLTAVNTALLLAAGAFVLQQLLAPFQTLAAELVARRVDGARVEELMACVLARLPVADLESQSVLDTLAEARSGFDRVSPTPGEATAGSLALIARYAQLAAATAMVAVVLGPLPGALVAVTALVIRFGQRGSLSRFGAVRATMTGRRRRLAYLRRTASGAGLAKEARMLGLVPWLRDRLRTEARAYLEPLWAARRRLLFRPFVALAVLGLLGGGTALAVLGRGAADGSLSLLQLSAALQAVLVPMRFGVFFPESDMQTLYGLTADDALHEIETMAEAAGRTAQEVGRAAGAAGRSADPAGAAGPVAGTAGAPAGAAPHGPAAGNAIGHGHGFGPASGSGAGPEAGRRPEAGRGSGSGSGTAATPGSGTGTGAIRFENVGFRYAPGSPDVLRDLDLDLVPGGSTAIVGLNGAGKTTLVKLLARIHEPTAGRVTAGGTDIAGLPPAAWHRQIAVIFQDFTRFQLTAAENIAVGRPDLRHDTAALRAAAERAGVLDLLDTLPHGLDTVLSSQFTGGTDLSGGQWQRVALARALLALDAGASLLILDEPTAQLDVRAEAAFFDRFLDLTRDVTSVIIAHRFSSVRRADRIVVLADGGVAESGTHEQLMALGGRYAGLFRAQAERLGEAATDTPRAGGTDAAPTAAPPTDPPAAGPAPAPADPPPTGPSPAGQGSTGQGSAGQGSAGQGSEQRGAVR